MKKTNRELERIIKGFANHRRLQVLELLYKEPELSVHEISEKLKSEFKNISAHVNKMAIAGLVIKRNEGNIIRHKLTKRGKSILQFVRIIE
ncbi:MAG: ArsR family transcriptional regulator [Candidatus Parcubacteria bacterium]|nr:ArsR family transcriptional regulator [Candidatus Parcubacteria bacterium]